MIIIRYNGTYSANTVQVELEDESKFICNWKQCNPFVLSKVFRFVGLEVEIYDHKFPVTDDEFDE